MADTSQPTNLMRVLTEFLGSTGAIGAFIIDRVGRLVAGAGKPFPFTVEELSALVAGSYSTVNELSKECGEMIPLALPGPGGVPSGFLLHLESKAALVFVGREGLGMSLFTATTKLPQICTLL